MYGQMMEAELTIISLIQYAAKFHGGQTIASRRVEGDIHRYTYADAYARAGQLANALSELGVQPGERIATLAWNGYRHLELYYAVPGMGAICHTINPRLLAEQIAYIVNHAEDTYLFFDLTFLPLVESLAPKLPSVKGFVALADTAHLPASSSIPNLLCYEALIADKSTAFDWPALTERTASSLCYTSGTTGNPKGVLYSHRSTVLHSFAVCGGDWLCLRSRDAVLPVVPMFHANAWGIPYAAAMSGAKLVFPGANMTGAGLYELFEAEGVTIAAGVPTVWIEVLRHLEQTGAKFSTLERMMIGGSAAPRAMIEKFEEIYNVRMAHGWGMTELSPVGSLFSFKRDMAAWPAEQRYALQAKQGRPLYGVDMKIVDDDGHEQPHDGQAVGDLLVRGPWVASGYYKGEGSDAFTPDGWFLTGDVAAIDQEGFIQLTDRSKDLIKSGGEWISSIDLENIAMAHPGVLEAAAIAVPHPKWQERPLLLVVLKEGNTLDREELLAFFKGKVASWWIPDDVVAVNELPHTATGKLLKRKLRQDFADYQLPRSV
jgi:acyl-CoA synthetase (AMP-forming)/AMP-acid ligase II